MRLYLSVVLAFLCVQAWSQSSCSPSSTLFRFNNHLHPRLFTEKLGNHPQFPFLQKEKGITSSEAVVRAAKNPDNRAHYKKAFAVFNALLKEIGLAGGYKDLKAGNVEDLFIRPGTVGNLGFFNKESNYIYVRLNPSGEEARGIAAWKITGPDGCYFYILHTCGNAFFANEPAAVGSDCCKTVGLTVTTDTLSIMGRPHTRPLRISIRFYQAKIGAGKKKKGMDTVLRLIRTIDTVTMVPDSTGRITRVYGKAVTGQLLLCSDTILSVRLRLSIDTTAPDSLVYILSDTSYIKEYTRKEECRKKWEISAGGGGSFNSIPRFDNTTEHTRTNGAQLTGEIAISRIFNHWFQVGISAAYIQLSYQDDLTYSGSAPNTYNTIYPSRPLIPVQFFGKATIGGPLGWQSDISLSAGYSIPGHGKITNSGNTLSATPSVNGGGTAGIKVGVAYFFNCRMGVGLSAAGQYLGNKGAFQPSRLIALPITLGIRYRF